MELDLLKVQIMFCFLSPSHHCVMMHIFAAVKCTEGYESLKDAIEPVLAEMNELIQDGGIEVGGVTIKLDIKLGSDVKFI